MTSSSPEDRRDLANSSLTIPSDSENYSANNEESPSPPSSSSSPMILYSPPTIWGLLRGAAINVLLPFINGLMLGFGELLAHEAAFRLGWSGTKVSLLQHDSQLELSCLDPILNSWIMALTINADIPERTSEQIDWARNRNQRQSYRETTEGRRTTGSYELGMKNACGTCQSAAWTAKHLHGTVHCI